ncbi:transposase [Streptomyces mirabilis]|uniref:transposase n=1 Tax=Streptomyces mirabilis TaxID=68239 RepID=UPI000AC6CF59|nr:transposase [Streptomyces mirabilis]
MPKPYPEEFREDVVRGARKRGPGVTLEQVAADFGVHVMTLSKWMRRADIGDGLKPGTTRQENAELREACRRIKLLEQENEVLRRAAAYLSQANLPGKGTTRSGADRGRDSRPRSRAGFSSSPGSPTTAGSVTRWPMPCSMRPFARTRCSDAHRDDPEFGYRVLADEARSVGLPWPTGPRGGSARPDRVADLPGQQLMERVREETRHHQEARPAGA